MEPGLAPFESSIAERYHEETKYSEASLRRDAGQGPPDWGRQPSPFKQIDGKRILLPTEGLPIVRRSGAEDSTFTHAPSGRPDLYRLSRVLWHTNGCTRIVKMGGMIHHFRAAPSAGAMYPTEVYVAVRDVPGIAPGIYDYLVLEHALVLVRAGDPWPHLETAAFHHPALAESGAAIILTAEWLRSAWRYRERGYRRALLDTGHVLGNLIEAGPVDGLFGAPLASFKDEDIERLLGIDAADEGVLAIVPLVDVAVWERIPPLPQHASATTEWRKASAAVGDRVPEGEPRRLAAALHLASRIGADARGVMAPAAGPLKLADGTATVRGGGGPTQWPMDLPVTATIAERRSTRAFKPGEIPQDALFRALEHAYPTDMRCFFAPTLLRTFVVATHVIGVPHGTYAYDPVARCLVELQRGHHGQALVHLGLGQEIFHHAAAAVIHTVDLVRAIERFGDRVYRSLSLDAGHIGERLNLALLREGVGVSGCGGYYDDEMNRVLGIPESQAVLYITSIGVPATEG